MQAVHGAGGPARGNRRHARLPGLVGLQQLLVDGRPARLARLVVVHQPRLVPRRDAVEQWAGGEPTVCSTCPRYVTVTLLIG